jgi:hypothetical protein
VIRQCPLQPAFKYFVRHNNAYFSSCVTQTLLLHSALSENSYRFGEYNMSMHYDTLCVYLNGAPLNQSHRRHTISPILLH